MADLKEFQRKMEKTLDVLASDFAAVRAGRANAQVLDRITVEYYGQPSPINQVGTVSSPDPRTLVIQPWDGSLLKAIEKAIQTSDLGINPQNDGRVIRLVFPQLTPLQRVRTQIIKGPYFNSGSTDTGVPASKPPAYPTHQLPKFNVKL